MIGTAPPPASPSAGLVHDTTLLGREEVAEGTIAFRLSRPTGFGFLAGQSVSVILPAPPAGPKSAQHTFSLASAPSAPELVVAMRMREGSVYKRALQTLPDGASLGLKGPRGAMTLHEDRGRAAILVAGGIGITPFLSMLRQAAHDRAERELHLVYANRRAQDAAFLAELRALGARLPGYHLHARMTDAEGYVDEDALRRFVGAATAPLYYLAGPPAMVEAMNLVLRNLGVGEADVRSEQFYGY